MPNDHLKHIHNHPKESHMSFWKKAGELELRTGSYALNEVSAQRNTTKKCQERMMASLCVS
ncbi:hypothetical protein [Pseudomonas sp. FME51]|uniref:hypothetical protein n=1 Tax=Pseudomonas sp. FME51 TaxID=2742609 RepID=UPI001868B34C|nr:hypothetical protein [Pseudomonas sp. FME51]